MDPATPGTLVAERYRLIREIGLGGMGSVWLAYDEALASRCALKLLHTEPARQEELALRLECEAKCAAQLRSPHVVDVFNRGQWQGSPFIVMEYLEGEDLAERLERVGRLDATTTYRIVSHVARALTRAHGLGIIHRDVKPANIFLVPGEEHEIAKVLDFGIAKHGALPNAFENPQQASFIGTPCYMSPEQARGGAVDYRCDLWALAMIAFECLTGALPFPDDSVPNVLQIILSGAFPAITANRPELPEALEAWWRRATAPDVDQRFQSAKEFADALGEALEAPKMPISRPDRPIAGVATAPTVLAPPELTPSRRAPAPAHAAFVAKVASRNAAVTLHAHAAPARRDSLRVPMRSHRGLALFGAALCAALGFGASSLNAKLDSSGLYRAVYAAASEDLVVTPLSALPDSTRPANSERASSIPALEPPPEPPSASAETEAAPTARVTPPRARTQTGAIVPASVVTPVAHVAVQRAAYNPARLQAEIQPELLREEPSEPTPSVVPVEAAPEVPSAAAFEAPVEPRVVPPSRHAPGSSDELPARDMPPGVKDYGI